jgi:hypothetical protein
MASRNLIHELIDAEVDASLHSLSTITDPNAMLLDGTLHLRVMRSINHDMFPTTPIFKFIRETGKEELKKKIGIILYRFHDVISKLPHASKRWVEYMNDATGGAVSFHEPICNCVYSSSSHVMCDSCILLSGKFEVLSVLCKNNHDYVDFYLKDFIRPQPLSELKATEHSCWSCREKEKHCLFCSNSSCNCHMNHERICRKEIFWFVDVFGKFPWILNFKSVCAIRLLLATAPDHLESIFEDHQETSTFSSFPIVNVILEHSFIANMEKIENLAIFEY